MVDRRVRVRSRKLKAVTGQFDDSTNEVITGILQHLSDDDVFHRNPTFLMLESEIGRSFRRLMPDPYDHRPPFLGHIVTELMLDAWIAEQNPSILSQYYDAMRSVDEDFIQGTVNQVATQQTSQLAYFIRKFREIEFLYDYLDDERMLVRLNQVLHRVKLPVLEAECTNVLHDARTLLRSHGKSLLAAVETAGGP